MLDRTLLVFIVVGLSQLAADVGFFLLFVTYSIEPALANVISRGIAVLLGFVLNSKVTFRKQLNLKIFFLYMALWGALTCVGGFCLLLVEWLPLYSLVVFKFFMEVFLAILSFLVMKFIIFKREYK